MAFGIADEGMVSPCSSGSLGAASTPAGDFLLQRHLRPCLERCPTQSCGEDGGMGGRVARGGGGLRVVGGQGFRMFKEKKSKIRFDNSPHIVSLPLTGWECGVFIGFTHCIQKHLVLIFVKMVIGVLLGAFK